MPASRNLMGGLAAGALYLGSVCAASATAALDAQSALEIPVVRDAPKRLITVNDLMALRKADSLSVSPDGRSYAVFVRQSDATRNTYRSGWFVGSASSGTLRFVGEGGDVGLEIEPNGYMGGALEQHESRWSPDGKWIAYKVRKNGQVQLWRSRADGTFRQQMTHDPADVRDFEWSKDGSTLYFTMGEKREELRAREALRERVGYQYDEDLYFFTDFMKPQLMVPEKAESSLCTVSMADLHERAGGAAEQAAFENIRLLHEGGGETPGGFIHDAEVPPVRNSAGALAWLKRAGEVSSRLRVAMSPPHSSDVIECTAPECNGAILRLWWSSDDRRVLIWRTQGINDASHAFFAWSPASGKVVTLLRVPEDRLDACELVVSDRLICIRETPTSAAHIAMLDLDSGSIEVLADLNPELKNIRLGRVERFEWNTPKLWWNESGGPLNNLYPHRAYGHILYPPDFDPSRTYPVFIEPYVSYGFNSSVGAEHPLPVYAAAGIVVLTMSFPVPDDLYARLGAGAMKQLYSEELQFPHLTMLSQSTLGGINAAVARGFVDQRRVGIGGVSHGTFVPLYILQKQDRIAAISISSPTWGPHEYYWSTRKGREWAIADRGNAGYEDWEPKPENAGRDFWRQFDIADHVDEVEAPILMNLAAHETYALTRFIRHLADAKRPYDVYVFARETHIKWQPAHLEAIMNRNLDWFRFWLQDYEDPAPAKSEQYARWRELRKLQCKNPRSLRDYCQQ